MASSGFDHRLLAELRRSDIGGTQTYLVQRILRAISKTSLFSQHVCGLAGMSAELPRARAMLASFAETGQPGRALVRAHCEAAAHAVARWGAHEDLVEVRRSLMGTASMIAVQTNPLDQVKSFALRTVSDIDTRLDKVHALVDNGLTEAWHGAAELTRLEALHPNAACSAVREPGRLGFGAALGRLRRFTQQISTNGAACLVACVVDAVDAPSAGRVARRELSELLDQYMAGHRLVALSLGDDVFVCHAGPLFDLNVAWLTSPTSTGIWSR